MSQKLLLFDLDGTLLTSDKKITEHTLHSLNRCRQKGYLTGVSTSRSEQNTYAFLKDLQPDILITSGGALVRKGEEYLYKVGFTARETRRMIEKARRICGDDCEITIDTPDTHFWNYKADPKNTDKTWGDSVWTDYKDFRQESLKMCVEIFEERKAKQLIQELPDCDAVRFSDGYWYKFTRKGVTKEDAINRICSSCGLSCEDITAFGDDYADIGMLKMAGTGVAMGNAIDEVKAAADIVIGSNDDDGIARYLDSLG